MGACEQTTDRLEQTLSCKQTSQHRQTGKRCKLGESCYGIFRVSFFWPKPLWLGGLCPSFAQACWAHFTHLGWQAALGSHYRPGSHACQGQVRHGMVRRV